ncbi:MAG: lytic murein transglycosylase [Parashewanella sp.]
MARIFIACSLFFSSVLFSQSVYGKAETYQSYLDSLLIKAQQQGVNNAVIAAAKKEVKQFKRISVVENQPKPTVISFDDYFHQRVTFQQVEALAEVYFEYQIPLQKIAHHYHVQPRFIISLWALLKGTTVENRGFSALSVYSSKAYEQQTPEMDQQFVACLKAVDKQLIPINDLKSNHKGELGQLHFSPTQFLTFGQDWDKDGKADIWHNKLDSFATVAFALQQAGWNRSQTWGRQVKLSKKLSDNDATGMKSFAQWQQLGVTRFDGSALPDRDDMQVFLTSLENSKGRYYLTYHNFQVLKAWSNMNDYQAMTVVLLSEKLKKHLKSKPR